MSEAQGAGKGRRARTTGTTRPNAQRGQEVSWDLLLRGALKYLERTSLKRGETLLLITEPPSDRRLADGLFEAAWQLGAHPIIATIPYRGEHNVDPPKTLAATMKAADAAKQAMEGLSALFG